MQDLNQLELLLKFMILQGNFWMIRGLSWSWSYSCQIYNCLCNQCLSPLKFAEVPTCKHIGEANDIEKMLMVSFLDTIKQLIYVILIILHDYCPCWFIISKNKKNVYLKYNSCHQIIWNKIASIFWEPLCILHLVKYMVYVTYKVSYIFYLINLLHFFSVHLPLEMQDLNQLELLLKYSGWFLVYDV
jgi:hypothetical protein